MCVLRNNIMSLEWVTSILWDVSHDVTIVTAAAVTELHGGIQNLHAGLVVSFYKVCPGNRRRRFLAVGVYRDLGPGGPVDRALRNARRGVTGGRSSRRRCLCDGPWPHLRVWRVSVCCVVGLVCRGGCGRLGLLS